MANKYCDWNMAKNFTNTEYVKSHTSSCNSTKKFFENLYTVSVTNVKSASATNDSNVSLCIEEIEIITRIASSVGLTFKQITSYLQMLGYHVSMTQIKSYLHHMIFFGLINLTHLANVVDYNTEDKHILYYYYLSDYGLQIAKEIGVPVPSEKQLRIIRKNFNLRNYILGNILWNQIVINQLLYNSNLIYFQIHKVEMKEKQPIHIPLLLRTKYTDYIFEYICKNSLDVNYLQNRMEQWDAYSKNRNIPFVLVLACENEEILTKVKRRTQYLSQYSFFYTLAESWFDTKSGEIYSYMTLSEQPARLVIDEL